MDRVTTSSGVVYLVGAGPGDPGLLTRRGAELLSRADVVAYDRLVDPSLLALSPAARLVDVGKRAGDEGRSQQAINDLLVAEAKSGKLVVRLKGGDPFVFGRGGEEAEALEAAGVRYEVVPGVTSAVAGPAYAGIPLTHREHASWVAIATGHEDPAKPGSGLDWTSLAKAPTAVFLMGRSRLSDIVTALTAAGRDEATPAALVASATRPSQRVVRSTLGRIAAAADAAGVEAPALLVVGDVASLGPRLDWWGKRPLAGKRVFVTRTRAQAGRLSELLRELGAEPLEYPAIAIEPPSDDAPLRLAVGDPSLFDWWVFTSPNAVDAVARVLDDLGRDARSFGGVRVAAVGPATVDRLRGIGIRPDLVPDVYTSAALAAAFPARRWKRRASADVAVPQAEDAPDDFERELARKNWRCGPLPAYRTVRDETSLTEGAAALAAGVDAVLFTSGSTVRNFVDSWGPPPADAVVCCIGPVTAEVAKALGVRVDAVADEHTIEGLVHALTRAVRP